jgi:hypothetical protein
MAVLGAATHPRYFRHEAFLYRSDEEFVTSVGSFARQGVAIGEAVAVALAEPRLSVIQAALGAAAEGVHVVDMAELGANPARIIPAWLRFVEQHCAGGRRARAVGEPIWHARRPAEIVECQLHEALLNVAMPRESPLWLRCPYDAGRLPASVLAEAAATHPILLDGGVCRSSRLFRGRDGGHSLPPFPADLITVVPATPEAWSVRVAGLGQGPAVAAKRRLGGQ